MPANTKSSVDLDLDRIVSLKRVAELRGCHVDTVKRNDRDKIIQLSPRRLGMRLRHALMTEA